VHFHLLSVTMPFAKEAMSPEGPPLFFT